MKKSHQFRAALAALLLYASAADAASHAPGAAASRARVLPGAASLPAALSLSPASSRGFSPLSLAAPAPEQTPAAPSAAARMRDAADALSGLEDLSARTPGGAHRAGVDVEAAMLGASSVRGAALVPAADEPSGPAPAAPGVSPSGPRPEIVAGAARYAPQIARMRAEFAKVIVGQREMIDSLLMGVLLQEHIALEGLPGVAKTLAAETLGAIIGVPHARIQGTPDLRPSDITGAEIIEEDASGRRTKRFEEGPIFARIVLFDEINRAQPRTQSATLSVMQERKVATRTGQKTTPLLMLIATQNPIEQDGTYRLPEAQEDRFMFKVNVPEPDAEARKLIMKRFSGEEPAPVAAQVVTEEDVREIGRLAKQVYVAEEMRDYINNVIDALKVPGRFGLDYGGQIEQVMSTRAALMILKSARMHAFMDGRAYVDVADVKAVAHRVMRHRIIVSYNASLSRDQLIDKALSAAPLPKPAAVRP